LERNDDAEEDEEEEEMALSEIDRLEDVGTQCIEEGVQ